MKKTGYHHHAGALVALLLLLSLSSSVVAVDHRAPAFLLAPSPPDYHQLPFENDNLRRGLLAAVGAASSAGGYGSACDGVGRGPGRVTRCSEVEGCAWRPDAKECVPQACSAYSAQPGCDLSPTCHWVVTSQGGGQAQGGCYGCSEVMSGEACRSGALRDACAWVQKGWYEGCHDYSEIQTEVVCNYINTGGSCYWAQGECKNFNLI